MQRRAAQPSGRHLPTAAQAALSRAAGEEGVGQAQHHLHSGAAVDHHQAVERQTSVPLLRPVQPRLRSEGELLEPRRADCAGVGDGQAHAHHQRDGARGHAWQRRPGERGVVHRQEHRRRRACARQDRRAGGQRVRDGADVVEFKVEQLSKRPRQLERHGGQVSHRHDRWQRRRVHSVDGQPHSAQPRRRGRHARVHALVARQQEARLPARLPYRSVGRHEPAVRPALAAAFSGTTAAATASSSRPTTASTTARRSASTAAAR